MSVEALSFAQFPKPLLTLLVVEVPLPPPPLISTLIYKCLVANIKFATSGTVRMPILLCGSRVRCIHYTYPVCVKHVVHAYSGFEASSPDCALHTAINAESHVRSDDVWHVRIRPSNTVITWLLAVYSAQSALETPNHCTNPITLQG